MYNKSKSSESKKPNKHKLLITGASGFLGWNLSLLAKKNFEVVGLSQSHCLKSPILIDALDLCNSEAQVEYVSLSRPQGVIHCAALSQPNDCEKNPELSEKVNLKATEQLASLCHFLNIRLLFISTEQVFDGSQAPYSEMDEASPIHVYGSHKALAEQAVLKKGGMVCRMPLMYGNPGPFARNFIQGWLENARQGKAISMFTDEIRTPLDVSSAAEGILLAYQHFSNEILHLGGPESISRFEFGKRLFERAGLSLSLAKASRQEEVKMAAPRPKNVSLNSAKALAWGWKPKGLDEGLSDELASFKQVFE